MSATTISLIAVAAAFAVLVWWVYSPSRRESIEARGRLAFLDDDLEAPVDCSTRENFVDGNNQ